MSAKVIVTGSNSGSYSAYLFIKFMLNLHDVTTKFFTPNKWNKNEDFDGLIISGGVDIDPKIYNEKRHKSVKKTEPQRDKMEAFLLEKAYKKDIPIFGICRGMQMINVFLGGSLYQHIFDLDLKYKHPKTILPLKEIYIKKHTKLYQTLKITKAKVNALHHQAVKDLGKDLIICAYDKNNITQAIEHTKKDILGVQWHPEYMPYSYVSKRLFKSFCDKVKEKVKR